MNITDYAVNILSSDTDKYKDWFDFLYRAAIFNGNYDVKEVILKSICESMKSDFASFLLNEITDRLHEQFVDAVANSVDWNDVANRLGIE